MIVVYGVSLMVSMKTLTFCVSEKSPSLKTVKNISGYLSESQKLLTAEGSSSHLWRNPRVSRHPGCARLLYLGLPPHPFFFFFFKPAFSVTKNLVYL